MDDRNDKEAVQRVFSSALASLNEDPYLAQRVLNAANEKGGTIMKKKLSLGFVLLIMLLALSVTALAAGIMLNTLTKNVAEMTATGQLASWDLDAKRAFVSAMREAGYSMDEADWSLLANESEPAQAREAAANRIIYARYGQVQEEANAASAQPQDTMFGAMPDAVEIFRERYLAEHPSASHYDYLDALGYWLRDEYLPALEAALPPAETLPDPLNRETAEGYLRTYLTEVLSWPVSTAKQAVLTSRQDASGAWQVTATAEGKSISRWIDQDSQSNWHSAEALDEMQAAIAYADKMHQLYVISEDDAEQVALDAIAAQYGLDGQALKRYFVYKGDTYTGDPACVRQAFLLRTRNNAGAPWDYAAIVNRTTGQADDMFTAEELFTRLPALAAAWEGLQADERWLDYFRWYTTWNPHDSFGLWPLDVQAQASSLFWTYGQQQKAQQNDPSDYYTLQMFVNHRYVLPAAGELNEEDATALALTAASQALHIRRDQLVDWQVERTFSRDEPTAPVWRFLLTDPTWKSDPCHAVVWLNGTTGEVIFAGSTSPEGKAWFTDEEVL